MRRKFQATRMIVVFGDFFGYGHMQLNEFAIKLKFSKKHRENISYIWIGNNALLFISEWPRRISHLDFSDFQYSSASDTKLKCCVLSNSVLQSQFQNSVLK